MIDWVYVDETGFPVDGEQYWVWTFVTEDEVLYTVEQSRGSQVLENVLGEFLAEDATLSCDGWSMYPAYHPKLYRCWAYLSREAEFGYDEVQQLCEELHELHDDLTAFTERDPSASARQEKRVEDVAFRRAYSAGIRQ